MKFFAIFTCVFFLSASVFAAPLTPEQRDILAYVVTDPDAWQSNNEATAKDEAEATKRLEAKLEKWKPIFEAEKVRLGVHYEDRVARDLANRIIPLPPLTNHQLLEREMKRQVFGALVRALSKQFNVTETQFKAMILNEME